MGPTPTLCDMPHRQFTDSAGHTWDVWDVHPAAASRTLAELSPHRSADAESPCQAVAPGLADGWLCFGQAGERRRLAPVPADWEALPPEELERLRDRAAPAPPAAERAQRAPADAPPAPR